MYEANFFVGVSNPGKNEGPRRLGKVPLRITRSAIEEFEIGATFA
jgi:hypothetical protein